MSKLSDPMKAVGVVLGIFSASYLAGLILVKVLMAYIFVAHQHWTVEMSQSVASGGLFLMFLLAVVFGIEAIRPYTSTARALGGALCGALLGIAFAIRSAQAGPGVILVATLIGCLAGVNTGSRRILAARPRGARAS